MPKPTPRISASWHLARWRHGSPGTRGLIILAIVGIALTLPSHRIGLGDSWADAHRIILTLGTLVAAFLIARDAAVSDELEFWLQYKGVSPADWALAKWWANLLPLVGTVTVFTALLFCAAPLYGMQPPVLSSLALIATLAGSLVVLSVMMFGLGATGSPNAPELGMLLVIVTVLSPAFAATLPAVLQAVLRFGLPPMLVVAELRDALTAGAWTAAGRLALHISGWCTLVMLGGVVILERRRPLP